MKNMKFVKYFSFVLAVLMLALLVMQFLPFWSTEDDAVSINGYIWLPNEHKDLTKIFKADYSTDARKFDPVMICAFPVLTLALGIAGILLCLIKRDTILPSILTIFCGLAGMLTYLTHPAFRIGSGWVLHLVVAIVVLVGGIAGLVLHLLSNKAEK